MPDELYTVLPHQPISQFVGTCGATVRDDLEALQQSNPRFRLAQQLEDIWDDVEAFGVFGIFERSGNVRRREGQLGGEQRQELAAMNSAIEARVCEDGSALAIS